MVSENKTQKWKYLGLLAILPLAMVALTPDLVDVAYAQKSEGTPSQVSPKSYGSATEDIVCGARLCSTSPGEPSPVNVGKAQ